MIKLLIITTLLSVAVSCGVSFSTAHAMESDCFITDVEVSVYRHGEQWYWVNRVCYDGTDRGYTTYGTHHTVAEINKDSHYNIYTTDPIEDKPDRYPANWFDGP